MPKLIDTLRRSLGLAAATPLPLPTAPPQDNRLYNRLMQRTLHRLNEDIGSWRSALRAAENRDYPLRRDLARVYREILLDAHLTAVINSRHEAVLGQPFVLTRTDTNGKTNPDHKAQKLLEQPWLEDLIRHLLQAQLEGYVLIELGEMTPRGPEGVYKFPMEYLDPVRGHLLPEASPGGTSIPYRSDAGLMQHLIEAGRPEDLGLLYKAAPHVLWKRSATKFWAEYCQLFGMPVAIARTSALDPTRKEALSQMLQDMRAAYHIVMDKEEELDFVESSRSDGSAVYDRLVDRCNSELSKLMLGQTMTTDNGSSLAQARVHQQVLHTLTRADLRQIERVMNNQVLPRLVDLGMPALAGLRFSYVQHQELTVDEVVALASRFEVDTDYLTHKYGFTLKPKTEKEA